MKKLIFLSIALLFEVLNAYSSNELLDPTFGSGGYVFAKFQNPSRENAYDIALQKDGKFVVLGSICKQGSRCNFVVLRYDVNGNLDKTFGTNGMTITDFAGGEDVAKKLVIAPDAKIYAVGQTQKAMIAVARYTSSGLIDRSFGKNGKLVIDRGTEDSIQSAAFGDSRLILTGTSTINNSSHFLIQMFAIGLTPNGKFDHTFGTDGIVQITMGRDTGANDLAIQQNGHLLLAGVTGHFTYSGRGSKDFALAKLLTDGRLDRSFGTRGTVRTNIDGVDDTIRSIAIQQDGKIVVAGEWDDSYSQLFAVARYNRDGSLDKNFARNGKTRLLNPYIDVCTKVLLDHNQRLIIGGFANQRVFLVRLNTDATLDKSFAVHGVLEFGSQTFYWRIFSMVLQSDGNIVVAGSRIFGSGSEIMLARIRMPN